MHSSIWQSVLLATRARDVGHARGPCDASSPTRLISVHPNALRGSTPIPSRCVLLEAPVQRRVVAVGDQVLAPRAPRRSRAGAHTEGVPAAARRHELVLATARRGALVARWRRGRAPRRPVELVLARASRASPSCVSSIMCTVDSLVAAARKSASIAQHVVRASTLTRRRCAAGRAAGRSAPPARCCRHVDLVQHAVRSREDHLALCRHLTERSAPNSSTSSSGLEPAICCQIADRATYSSSPALFSQPWRDASLVRCGAPS